MADHDNSYKYLFSHARMVEDLLKGFVKEQWVKELVFDTLEKVNGSYVSDDLRDRADDIVWRLRWGKDWLYVYILLEFQSTVDSWMAVRIMTYVGLLYQDLIRTGQLTIDKMLPPVLPVVLYNGDGKWTAATDISELIREIPGGLSRYRPSLQYLLLAERDYGDEELKELNNLVAALFRLENSRNPQQLLEVVVNLLQWLSSPQQDSLRRAFTVWFARVLFPTRFDDENKPIIEELDEVKNMLAERVKEWNRESLERGLRRGRQEGRQEGIQEGQQKGRQEGRQEGIQEGRQEGRQEGAQQVLQRLLVKKFGTLPPQILLKMSQADETQLLQWSERILSSETLEDVLNP